MYVFFIKVTQLSVLRYCENHTILFHWVCERALQAKKSPQYKPQLPPENRVPQILYLPTCIVTCHMPEDQKR